LSAGASGPGTEAAAPRRRSLVLAGSVFVSLIALAHLVPFLGYLTDDTFIHLQFAKHWIAGEGFSFNAGEPTYGATSPLWVMLLAGLGRAVPGAADTPADAASMPPLAWLAKGLGALFTVLGVLAIGRAGRRVGFTAAEAAALGVLYAANAWSARWAISGMESPLAACAVAVALAAAARTLLEGRGAFELGIALGIAVLARPECWMLAAFTVGAVAAAREPGRARRIAGVVAGLAIAAGPWLAAAAAWFHRITPNTSGAKAGAWADVGRALDAVRTSIRVELASDALLIGLAVLALALAGPRLLREMPLSRRLFWILVAAWPLGLIAGYAAGGVQVVSRYLLLAMPSVLLLGVASLRWATARLDARARALTLALLLAAYAGQNAFVTFRYNAPHARRHTQGLRESLVALGIWARTQTAEGTLFALPDIGAFGYYSDRPVLDLYGLVTPRMAPIAVHAGYDAVVENLLYEPIARPAYLIDRSVEMRRLESAEEPLHPYEYLFSRSIPDLGLTRPQRYYFSVYAVHWEIYDRAHPKLALVRIAPG
jgi:hypothetical protein